MAAPARLGLLAVLLSVSSVVSAPTRAPEYVLDGYRFEGIAPKVSAGLVAGFKHHAGARVREEDIKADVDILAKELHAQHITGRLFTGMAEGNGHLVVFFQLVDTNPAGAKFWTSHHLVSQEFEGLTGVPAGILARISGLKTGDLLSPEKVEAARRALLAEAKKLDGHNRLTLKVRIQSKPPDKAALTWIFGESK